MKDNSNNDNNGSALSLKSEAISLVEQQRYQDAISIYVLLASMEPDAPDVSSIKYFSYHYYYGNEI